MKWINQHLKAESTFTECFCCCKKDAQKHSAGSILSEILCLNSLDKMKLPAVKTDETLKEIFV